MYYSLSVWAGASGIFVLFMWSSLSCWLSGASYCSRYYYPDRTPQEIDRSLNPEIFYFATAATDKDHQTTLQRVSVDLNHLHSSYLFEQKRQNSIEIKSSDGEVSRFEVEAVFNNMTWLWFNFFEECQQCTGLQFSKRWNQIKLKYKNDKCHP